MKERLFQSFAILLAGLFSAERPRAWQLGDAAPRRRELGVDRGASEADEAGEANEAPSPERPHN